jgi:pyrrolysine biosynthesis protein PylC
LIVGIVGGKLQGVEAAYLARKAGWEVRIVDKKPGVPASGLCDSFAQADVNDENKLDWALGDVDFIIPALEDDNALVSLSRWSRETGVPLAFDPQAYAVSSSKLNSTEIFKKIGLPIPAAWPQCNFPVLAKPGIGSGSKGVRIFQDFESMQAWFAPNFPPPDWVLEEFLDGGQHSLEVIGRPGNYRLLQVTDLYVDQDFDCKRVIAPTNLPQNLTAEFEGISLTIAEAINLHGIMDVEAIYSRGEFKVLEIDARLPSQTPTAVYWSTNSNILRLLGDLFVPESQESPATGDILRGTVYEHIHVCGNMLKVCGEGIMTQGGPLKLQDGFFGADEALTDYAPGRDPWVATLIFGGADRNQAREKRDRCIAEIARRFEIKEVIDPQPVVGTNIVEPRH